MGVPTRFPDMTRFGLLYSAVGLLILIPVVMLFGRMWGLYPHSVGFMLHITSPVRLTSEAEGRLILTIHCPKAGASPATEPEFQLNSRPVLQDQLPGALRAALSIRAHRVLYLRGDGCLAVSDVVHVVDIARGAWYGLPIVLLPSEPEPTSQP